jgi:hypothetical protein
VSAGLVRPPVVPGNDREDELSLLGLVGSGTLAALRGLVGIRASVELI